MGKDTKIEWCTHTFNPWRGCTKVSAGCANCYAEAISKRNPGVLATWGPNGTRVVAVNSVWRHPLAWNKDAEKAGERHRVFCASLADVFEDWQGDMVDSGGAKLWATGNPLAPWISSPSHSMLTGEPFPYGRPPNPDVRPLTMDDVRARLFGLILRTPHLDWLLLTKRPQNVLPMLRLLESDLPGISTRLPSNVWLGTSVEDQAAADERIPHLLRVPAKVRFLSMEPLLGPVDLIGWGSERATAMGVPATWPEYRWDDWVPIDQRDQIMSFWGAKQVRTPSDWRRDNVVHQRTPETGATVGYYFSNPKGNIATVCKSTDPKSQGVGRWLHCWNNMGRVITEASQTLYASASTGPGWLLEADGVDGAVKRRINWVILGGESGSTARDCDLVWLRSLVKQCQSYKVPVFVKQLGSEPVAWKAAHEYPSDGDTLPLHLVDKKGGDITEWPADLRVREVPHVV